MDIPLGSEHHVPVHSRRKESILAPSPSSSMDLQKVNSSSSFYEDLFDPSLIFACSSQENDNDDAYAPLFLESTLSGGGTAGTVKSGGLSLFNNSFRGSRGSGRGGGFGRCVERWGGAPHRSDF